MRSDVAAYLEGWLGDNPFPEQCKPSCYYVEKVQAFEAEPRRKGCTVMLGDSITDFADWDALFPGCNVINRGIAGDFVEGITLRLDEVASNEPSQVFFLAGCNNFVKGLTNTPEDVMTSLDSFFRAFREKMPETPLHVQSLMPMNPAAIDWNDHYNADVAAVNAFLIANADKYGYDYIDIASPLTDADGTLRSDLTEDGCHPNEAAYAIWAETIKNKIIK